MATHVCRSSEVDGGCFLVFYWFLFQSQHVFIDMFIGWYCNILRKRPVYYRDLEALFMLLPALYHTHVARGMVSSGIFVSFIKHIIVFLC